MIPASKSTPGGMEFGPSSAATTTHLAGELLAQRAGAKLTHVPYKGGGQAVNVVVGGQIPLIFTVMPTVSGFIKDGRLHAIGASSAKRFLRVPVKAGKLKALAVTSKERLSVFPDAPTITELGYQGFVTNGWYAMLLPAKTPAPVVAAYNNALNAALATPAVLQKFRTAGLTPTPGAPELLDRQIREDAGVWKKIITEQGIKPE